MATMCSSTKYLVLFFSLLLSSLLFSCILSKAYDVSYDGKALTVNGERKIIISGSIHYPRSTRLMWYNLISKAREGGLNAIDTYVFWNAHEPQRRQYDFSGNNDLVGFIREVGRQGLFVNIRIGPYVSADWNYGGLPVWLHNMPGVEFRTDNKVFQEEMANFTTLIVKMMRDNQLFAYEGGPIILAQIENGYGDVMSNYGDGGQKYLQWCARLAQRLNIGVPWTMSQQDNAPAPMINTCNGWYCDQFHPNNNNVPKMWTEAWTGGSKNWGQPDKHRPVEDLAFAVARFFQYGGTFQNYYMYHGGTNFGRVGGGPYVTTSYEFDAPLDEYGNRNQPKWGHLKRLHDVLTSMEDILMYGIPTHEDHGNMVDVTSYENQGEFMCFVANSNQTHDAIVDVRNSRFFVPAWSVSVLHRCYVQLFNTAEVNSQTTIMEKDCEAIPSENTRVCRLNWQWAPGQVERMREDGSVEGSFLTSTDLLDQKVTNDTSDYLWYLTRVDHDKTESVTLRVGTAGHGLHVFVNGRHIGAEYAPYDPNGNYPFTFEADIILNSGNNEIALLSATVGLTNKGAFFDTVKVGVTGPVEILGVNKEVKKDLTNNQWVYKAGVQGVSNKLYQGLNSTPPINGWNAVNETTNQKFAWYKASFPPQDYTTVVDFKGLGKGHAWVNGHSIGRYWPSQISDNKSCSQACNYQGLYEDKKCLQNCGQPTQRWYHIPREFMDPNGNDNHLVLFEELGGSPYDVKVESIIPGKACAKAYDQNNMNEDNVLELSCEPRYINEIKFASFGDPHGSCGNFTKGSCESPLAMPLIRKECLGKNQCSIKLNEVNLGATGCNERNRLAVEVGCGLYFG